MDGITFNVNSLDRADVLTSAASYAEFRLSLRNGETALKRNHVDGLYGAVFSAGTATGAVHIYNAYILVEDHASGLCVVLLVNRKWTNGAGRADLAADGAVVVAISVIKLHHGLHQTAQSVFQSGRLKHVAGAFAYAKMASGTVIEQILMAYGTGR